MDLSGRGQGTTLTVLVLHLACATVQPSPPPACQTVPSPAQNHQQQTPLLQPRWVSDLGRVHFKDGLL